LIKEMANNTPQLLKGFRDFGPGEMTARQIMLAKIRAAFERFGFQPMETPALEYAQTLLGKYGAEEKLMYRFSDAGGREVAMRYDLTVPLARFYAQRENELPRPFKRYCIGPVWRAENTQKGRFREFYQCDVDCIGSKSPLSDAEAVAAVAAAIADLGVEKIKIRINNRKLTGGILAMLGVSPEQSIAVIRLMDKLDKQPEKTVWAEMVSAGIKDDQVAKLFGYLNKKVSGPEDVRSLFSEVLTENSLIGEGVGELCGVLETLEFLDVKNVVVDLALARGLDYYTGLVCEIVLPELPAYGSIAGGGRYDNLIGTAGGLGKPVPAVGMSIGIDRLIAALDELGLATGMPSDGVLIFNLDERFLKTYLTVSRELRKAEINSEVYYQTEGMDKQFRYAEKKNIGLAVIVGEDEVKKCLVTLKNLTTRKQRQVKAERLITEVLSELQ
jgi:histidyl-tRNA synthetase